MLVLLLILSIAAPTIYLSPTTRTKVTFAFHFVLLYFLMAGVLGFVESDQSNKKDSQLFAVYATYGFIWLLHFPLIYRLYSIDHHKQLIKNARNIFNDDIKHLSDGELHHSLKH